MLSIYVHIPFCKRKCDYCDFLSFSKNAEDMEKYVRALLSEIKSANVPPATKVKSIFLGGGTPSFIDSKYIGMILSTIREKFDVVDNAEISIEANPGTVSMDKLLDYQKYGINRISIGCQSLNDDELRALSRIHDSKTFFDTFKMAREAGFTNINVDIMSALPGQSLESYKDTLSKIVSLSPEHISAYSLIIEEGTKFYDIYKDVIDRDIYDIEYKLETENLVDNKENFKSLEQDKYNVEYECSCLDCNTTTSYSKSDNTPCCKNGFAYDNANILPLPSEDTEREMYDFTKKFLSESGYVQYEISNFSKYDKYKCIHNLSYWERGEYLGFGIGSAGLYDEHRFNVTRDFDGYCNFWNEESSFNNLNTDVKGINFIDYISKIPNIYENIEEIDIKSQIEETMFLGLRKTKGVSKKAFKDTFWKPIEDFYEDILIDLENKDLIENTDEYVRLTDRGVSVSNLVMSSFLFD